MKKRSKRYKEAEKAIDRTKEYSIEEAIETLKSLPKAKFDETVELNFQLGIDPKANQTVRGMVSLPHGTGKTVKILCFCRGEEAKEAEAQGADFVGADDLVQKVQIMLLLILLLFDLYSRQSHATAPPSRTVATPRNADT